MSTFGNQTRESMIAGEDMSAAQFYGVVRSGTTDRVVTLGDNGEAAMGIAQNNPGDGGAVTVCTFGRTQVAVGTGGITRGGAVALENGGTVVDAATGDVVIGYAVETAAADTIGTIDFFPGGNVVA